MHITGEIVTVAINGNKFEAEILDITDAGAYVYVLDTGSRVNVRLEDIYDA